VGGAGGGVGGGGWIGALPIGALAIGARMAACIPCGAMLPMWLWPGGMLPMRPIIIAIIMCGGMPGGMPGGIMCAPIPAAMLPGMPGGGGKGARPPELFRSGPACTGPPIWFGPGGPGGGPWPDVPCV